MKRFLHMLVPLLLFSGCKDCPDKVPPFTWQEFNGRDEYISYGQMVRRPVYRAQVPLGWQRVDPPENLPISDTTKAIVSFVLEGGVTLSVHTFPSDSLEERISPWVQIERWRGQLKNGECLVEEVDHGGFTGLRFEGKNEAGGILAWSLQLDAEHYQTLRFLAMTVEEEEHYKQMGSDYTIKAIGSAAQLQKLRHEIELFAESFELIQEIPPRM